MKRLLSFVFNVLLYAMSWVVVIYGGVYIVVYGGLYGIDYWIWIIALVYLAIYKGITKIMRITNG